MTIISTLSAQGEKSESTEHVEALEKVMGFFNFVSFMVWDAFLNNSNTFNIFHNSSSFLANKNCFCICLTSALEHDVCEPPLLSYLFQIICS